MWQRISAHEFVPSRLRTRRWEPKGKVVRDDDLGAVHVIEHVTGNEFAAGSVAVGPLGWRTRNRSLIVKPGAQIRKPRVKYLLPWRRSALIVCQAMSMAMTVVLPAPVAQSIGRWQGIIVHAIAHERGRGDFGRALVAAGLERRKTA